MRFRHPDGDLVHLSYCSNVHPADDLDGVVTQLERFSAPIRERLGLDRLGVGLWLAAPVVADPDEAVARLKPELDRLGLETVTFNGFPYRGFHDPVVKLAVYRPDWSDPARAEYLLSMAKVLTGLLPDDVETGSISTVPIAWRTDLDDAGIKVALENLKRFDENLGELADTTGRQVELALEPEPGCLIETTSQAIDLLADLDLQHVGICVDTCHLACQFENGPEALGRLAMAGLTVPKAQVSNSLRVERPRSAVGQELISRFVEPRFMHQVREIVAGEVREVDDLPEALDGGLPGDSEWRIHFHVPVQTGEHTTRASLEESLDALVATDTPHTRHLEIETYTWNVLPDPPRSDDELVAGIAEEIAWTAGRLEQLGLEKVQ